VKLKPSRCQGWPHPSRCTQLANTRAGIWCIACNAKRIKALDAKFKALEVLLAPDPANGGERE
jgi:hypothetical protein